MYYTDYKALKAQMRTLEKAFVKGKISEELYNKKIDELNKKIKDYEAENKLKDEGVLGVKVENGHFAIDLKCSCGCEGTVTCGKIDFKLLGKDRKGFIYFECTVCKEHLQYNPLTGNTKTRKGVLGFLFGRFS